MAIQIPGEINPGKPRLIILGAVSFTRQPYYFELQDTDDAACNKSNQLVVHYLV